jgi:hypothetical protein
MLVLSKARDAGETTPNGVDAFESMSAAPASTGKSWHSKQAAKNCDHDNTTKTIFA